MRSLSVCLTTVSQLIPLPFVDPVIELHLQERSCLALYLIEITRRHSWISEICIITFAVIGL